MTGRLKTSRASWVLGACLVAGGVVSADRPRAMVGSDNEPYDGRCAFIRLSCWHGLWDGFGSARALRSPWAHDSPRADVHFMKILEEVTLLTPRNDGSNILPLDHPDLFQFWVACMSEPGFWRPSEAEVAGMRAYLEKGGFVIFDDFRGPDWYNLQDDPEGRLMAVANVNNDIGEYWEFSDTGRVPVDLIRDS